MHVFLGHNPWRCDCHFIPRFQGLLRKYKRVIRDLPDIRCPQSNDKQTSLVQVSYIKSCRWTTYLALKTGETLGGITELIWLTWCYLLISGSFLELIVSRILLTTQSKFCKCYIFYSKIYEIGKYLYVMLVCTKNVVTQREMENYICRGIAGVDCTTSNSVGSNPTKINLLFRRAWTFGSVC